MKSSKLLYKLINEISNEEWEELNSETNTMIISEHNRKTLLLMNEKKIVEEKEIPNSDIQQLIKRLQDYLNKYMDKQMEGHKWIIIASVFLTFIEEKPMHPIDTMKIEVVETSKGLKYYCSYKSEEENSVCKYCVCNKKGKNK